MALVTLARARYHPEAGQVDDTLLQAALDVAEEKVITLLGNSVALAEHTEVVNCTDSFRVWVKELPLVSITSMTVTDRITLETTTIDPTTLEFDPKVGEIRFAKGETAYFPLGWMNLQIVYWSGVATATEDIQEAIVSLALALVEVAGTSNMMHLGSEDADYADSFRAACNTGTPLILLQLLHDRMVPGVHNGELR